MPHRIIRNFYIAVKGTERSVVKFLVKSEGEQRASAYTVCAEIPNDALKYDMIKAGSSLALKGEVVYIEIEGVKDVAFKKIGNVDGDEASFYEHFSAINPLEEKGSKGIKQPGER